MLVVYVKLWRIDGQKQTHIKGKMFRIESVLDIDDVLEWVDDVLENALKKEAGGNE